jgi:hypothetical protein
MKLSLLLLAIFTLLLGNATYAQKADEKQLPLAKLAASVSVSFDGKDVDWLQHGGEIAVSVLVDKKGKVTVADLTGPAAPCGDLSSEHLLGLRTATIDAVKKAKFEPATDADGKQVDGGVLIRIKVPANPATVVPAPEPGSPEAKIPKLVSAGVLNGKAVSLARPEYPPDARANHASGAVSVQVFVDETGKIVTAAAISGSPYLRYAATDAACRSKLTPTLLAGHAVRLSGFITYNFVP